MAEIESPTEAKIKSISIALSMGVGIDSIRDDLISEGYSEYAIFLTVKAAEVNNSMRDKDFPVEKE